MNAAEWIVSEKDIEKAIREGNYDLIITAVQVEISQFWGAFFRNQYVIDDNTA